MPFGLGIGEVVLLIVVLGIVVGGGYLVVRGATRIGGGGTRRELEAATWQLEAAKAGTRRDEAAT